MDAMPRLVETPRIGVRGCPRPPVALPKCPAYARENKGWHAVADGIAGAANLGFVGARRFWSTLDQGNGGERKIWRQ